MMIRLFRSLQRRKAAGPDQEGSAIVELALSLPLLTGMLLGTFEFAQFAYVSIETVNAAHAGAVYAAYSHGHSSDLTGIGNAATADAGNLVGIISVTSATTSCSCSDGTPLASCSDNSTCLDSNTSMITAVTVKAQANYAPLVHPPGLGTFTLKAQSTQVVENQ